MPIDKSIDDVISEIKDGKHQYKLKDGTTVISVPSFNLID